jgi:catechol 2,3-dioxygenase-like lactoylglutathione lyase family enzyme
MAAVRIVDVAHVRFAAPDLGAMRGFLEDFGLICFEADGRLYGRGADGAPFAHVTEPGAPAFLALGLRAASVEDLQTLAAHDGVAVEPFAAPGGGSVVRLRDPDGNLVEVVAGQATMDAAPAAAEPPRNTTHERARLRQAVRLRPGPSHVHRLGHVVLNVRDFRASERWYKERFGFLTSDEIEMRPGAALGAFLRCHRGDVPTDHHTLFLAQLPTAKRFNHAAFEVADFDDLMLGHAHLEEKRRSAAWGIGRHILGSQIFDYWKDPWGNELEHWTDGDLFTAADPPRTASMRDLLGVQWGARHPMATGRIRLQPETIGRLMAWIARVRQMLNFRPSGAER